MGIDADKKIVTPKKTRRFLTILFGIPSAVFLPVFLIFYLAAPIPEVSLTDLFELMFPFFGFMFIFSIPAAILDMTSDTYFKAVEPSSAEREVMRVGGKGRFVLKVAVWSNGLILPVLFASFLVTDKEENVGPNPWIALALLSVISVVGSIAISSAFWNRFMSKNSP